MVPPPRRRRPTTLGACQALRAQSGLVVLPKTRPGARRGPSQTLLTTRGASDLRARRALARPSGQRAVTCGSKFGGKGGSGQRGQRPPAAAAEAPGGAESPVLSRVSRGLGHRLHCVSQLTPLAEGPATGGGTLSSTQAQRVRIGWWFIRSGGCGRSEFESSPPGAWRPGGRAFLQLLEDKMTGARR